MTPASLKTQIIWLEDRIINLEKRLDAVERLNKPPTKPIATGKQWGWTLIPKPLTDEEIDKAWAWAQKSSPHGVTRLNVFARAVEKAHGIGEKEVSINTADDATRSPPVPIVFCVEGSGS